MFAKDGLENKINIFFKRELQQSEIIFFNESNCSLLLKNGEYFVYTICNNNKIDLMFLCEECDSDESRFSFKRSNLNLHLKETKIIYINKNELVFKDKTKIDSRNPKMFYTSVKKRSINDDNTLSNEFLVTIKLIGENIYKKMEVSHGCI